MEAIDLIKLIIEFLDSHTEIGKITQTMYDPDKLEKKVSFAVLEKDDAGKTFKRFSVTIEDTLNQIKENNWKIPAKSIQSRYAEKVVNNKFYEIVTVDGLIKANNNIKILTQEEFANGEPGYILNSDKRDEYKDLNNCVCTECGDRHTAHERVSDPFKE